MQFMLVHNKEDLRNQQYKTEHFLTIANVFSKKTKKPAGISSSCKVKHAL